ncbi:UDP-2,3-diacylglucosamine diphosphatase [Gemmata sp.]|uniref:UDP-2,3-diacylglucosamine diphosphatase n=1 Tax=Gemmata sp. TaxID=1914242 RepID=UPI003F6ED54B
MFDALVISDIHLGSDNCQARFLTHFLASVRRGFVPTRRLILNGDVFDSIDFRRLKKHHWKILSEIRKLSDEIEVVWINGNHDGPAEIVSHLLGVACADEIVVESGGRKVLFLHGHRFDEFISRYPLFTWFADRLYHALQKLDKTHTFAKFAKRNSKTFLRSTQKIEAGALKYAAKKGCHAVCCGHTHHPIANTTGPVHYFNSGCWTEKPCHYLTLRDGVIELARYSEEVPDEVFNPPASLQETVVETPTLV